MSMRATAAAKRLVSVALTLLLLASGAAAELPPEGRCPDWSGGARAGKADDRGPPLIREGSVLGLEDLLALETLLPEEIWNFREIFFFEGMQMELGPCHRRYQIPDFFREATEKFAERVRLDSHGDLHGYVAGTPFPQDDIDPEAPDAGAKWAWNFQYRYMGAGPVGKFRIFDLPGRIGSPQTYLGDFFYIRTGHRADLAANSYRTAELQKSVWVAGGRFDEPFNARHLAWRQVRPEKADRKYKEADDTFVYVPTMRKSRRAATTWVDGIFTPRYTVSGDAGGGGIPFATGAATEGGSGTDFTSIHPTAGLSIQATEDIRRGFTGLAIRPNAYEWRLVAEREVLAPLNARVGGYPGNPNRNFGFSGLSVANDRWDLRYAVVIEGRARRAVDGVASVVLWIDYQTLQPLYMITKRKNGLLLDVGILVHRFSSDLGTAYPEWPGGELAHVFDPVAAVFYYVPGGAGWRRESYDVRSVPVDPDKLRKMTSMGELEKGH
jgi:hypothetical protein